MHPQTQQQRIQMGKVVSLSCELHQWWHRPDLIKYNNKGAFMLYVRTFFLGGGHTALPWVQFRQIIFFDF